MIARITTAALLALCLAACAGNGATPRSTARADFCPTGSIKVCTSLFELSRERYPSCACSELISSR